MWIKNLFSNFQSTVSHIAQKIGQYGKVIWSNIPHLLQGAKTIGSVLTRSGFIPIGPAIEQGADAIRGIYDNINKFVEITKLPDNA